MSSLTFFLSDVGLRYLQILELIKNNWQTLAIEYKALPFDPELAHIPYYYAYSLIDGGVYFKITPFLPILASGFYVVMGPIGLAIVPVLGTILSAIAVYKLAKLTELPQAHWLLWITAIATPLFFYSFELWDHTIAVACAAWACLGVCTAVIQQKLFPAFLGGIALGVGTAQRPEMYVYALALGIATLIIFWARWRLTAVLVAGSITGILPLWILQYRWVGHPLGMALAPNLFDYGNPESYPFESVYVGISRWIIAGRFFIFVQSDDPVSFMAVLFVLIGFIITFASLRQDKWRTARNLTLGLVLSLIGYGMYALLAVQSTFLVGLITTFPLLVFSLAYVPGMYDNGRYRPTYVFIFLTFGIFTLLMVFFWPASGGLQWGARYLLPAIPLLVYLAAYAIHAYSQIMEGKSLRAFRRLALGLLGLMFIIQIAGLKTQIEAHQDAQKVRDYIGAFPAEIVLTNAPFVPSYMYDLADKTFIYVTNDDDLTEMITRLAHKDVAHFAVFSLDLFPLLVPDQVEQFNIQPIQNNVYQLEKIK